jgi:hypothetical protein
VINTVDILFAELQERGIRIWLDAGKVKLAPADLVTHELMDRLRPHKDDLRAALLAHATEAQELINKILGKVEALRESASFEARLRVERKMKEFKPIIAALLDAGDFLSLRYCLLDLERNVRDAVSGRGYDMH